MTDLNNQNNKEDRKDGKEHESDVRFYEYYAQQSLSDESIQRFIGIRDAVMRIRKRYVFKEDSLDVADVGCNAGTQSMMWAKDGHIVHGVDINDRLVELARERADKDSLNIDFRVGSATKLPWDNESMDICLVPELLEHIEDWDSCVSEVIRVLKPGGAIYISTSNLLCPRQQEFNLPFYSWYPPFLKKHYEHLSVTSRPELANYAKYPAVHWFTFYGLRKRFNRDGLVSFDRFDIMDIENKSTIARVIVSFIRRIPLIRFFAHIATPYTVIVAVKNTS